MSAPRLRRWLNAFAVSAMFASIGAVVVHNAGSQSGDAQFLNVSYDPTRELYRDIDGAFAASHERATGERVVIRQSHGGSARQSRSVVEGVPADVVTLALAPDVDALRRRGLIDAGWQARLPNGSVPYTSTIVFVVRKGNPRHIRDFTDLVAPDVAVVVPNPKTSGNGKLAFLAAWGSVLRRGGKEEEARSLVSELYRHVVTLDDGARSASMKFAHEKIGDVHLTWENEAWLEVAEVKGELEIVYPPASILAEPPVAWVDANVRRKGHAALAKAYLEFLFGEEGQEIAARHHYRPTSATALERHRADFPPIDLFPVSVVAPDWDAAQRRFFDEDGIFDGIYVARR
jgi:sulfate transport system substrate-binding protein